MVLFVDDSLPVRWRRNAGVLRFPSGNVYEGDFENNVMSGQGEYKWADGSRYHGAFVRARTAVLRRRVLRCSGRRNARGRSALRVCVWCARRCAQFAALSAEKAHIESECHSLRSEINAHAPRDAVRV